MICKNCGKELRDTDKFCTGCGAAVGQEAEPLTVTEETVPAPKKKGVPKGLIIGVVAVVLVAAVAVMFLSGLFTSDAVKLANAFVKSGEAFRQALAPLDTVPAQNGETPNVIQEYSGEMELWLVDIPDGEELEGFGLTMGFDYSQIQRHLGMSLVPSFGTVDLLEAQVQIRENEMYLGVPQLTGDTYYMIRTDILGQEMADLGAEMDGAENFGFNVFDMVEQNNANTQQTVAQMEAFYEVLKSVGENLQVEKTGSGEIDVNGTQMKADCYHVVIPQQCVSDIMDALEPLYLQNYSNDTMLDMYRSMGMPEEAISAMEESLKEAEADAAESYAEAKEALLELGDLELDAFVSDGYVVALEFTVIDEDVTVDFRIALGGGENYVDNLSLDAKDREGEGALITLVGDHSAAGGAYTDTMTYQILEDGAYTTEATWTLRYAPQETDNNFSFSLEAEDAGISLEGQLTIGEQEFAMELDEVAISEYGENLMVIGMEYRIGAYEPKQVDTSDYMILSEMTEADQQNAMNDISGNAMSWLMWLQSTCPELMELLMG